MRQFVADDRLAGLDQKDVQGTLGRFGKINWIVYYKQEAAQPIEHGKITAHKASVWPSPLPIDCAHQANFDSNVVRFPDGSTDTSVTEDIVYGTTDTYLQQQRDLVRTAAIKIAGNDNVLWFDVKTGPPDLNALIKNFFGK